MLEHPCCIHPGVEEKPDVCEAGECTPQETTGLKSCDDDEMPSKRVCTEYVRSHFDHTSFFKEAVHSDEDPLPRPDGIRVRLFTGGYSSGQAVPQLLRQCQMDSSTFSPATPWHVIVQPGSLVSLKGQDDGRLSLVTCVFQRKADGHTVHMVQVRGMFHAKETILGRQGRCYELFLSFEVRCYDVQDIRSIHAAQYCKLPQDVTGLDATLQDRDTYQKLETYYYSFVFDPRTGKLLAPDLDELPYGRFFTSDGRGLMSQRHMITHSKKIPAFRKRLSCLDLFAGCGGLTAGLVKANLVDRSRLWAVESWDKAASTFQANFPEASVLTTRCDLFLQLAETRHAKSNAAAAEESLDLELVPRPGEVDVIASGPPCQGFSGLNVHEAGDVSRCNRAHLTTCLSIIEVYRPALVLLENVRGMVKSHHRALERTVACLSGMGYQVHAALLNAADFGVAQSRSRLVVMGSLPWVTLPEFPQMTHYSLDTPPPILRHSNGTSCIAPQAPASELQLAVPLKKVFEDLPHSATSVDAKTDATVMGRDDAILSLHVCKAMPKGFFTAMNTKRPMRSDESKPANCVTCSPHWNSLSGRQLHPKENRYFTIREVLRLQSFPDSFRLMGSIRDMYKMVGNAVPVLLAEKIGVACKEAVCDAT